MTVPDMLQYWRDCLNEWGNVPDKEIASSMVSVLGSDHFDDARVEADGESESDFSKLFELVLSLESDYSSEPARSRVWDEVRKLLRKLEKEHL